MPFHEQIYLAREIFVRTCSTRENGHVSQARGFVRARGIILFCFRRALDKRYPVLRIRDKSGRGVYDFRSDFNTRLRNRFDQRLEMWRKNRNYTVTRRTGLQARNYRPRFLSETH